MTPVLAYQKEKQVPSQSISGRLNPPKSLRPPAADHLPASVLCQTIRQRAAQLLTFCRRSDRIKTSA
jgi:hypothetical protein